MMRPLVTIFLFLFMMTHAELDEIKEREKTCLQIDIMLVADYSESVIGHESFIINALNEFVKRFDLSEDGMKIGLITFNSYAYTISPLTSDVDSLKMGLKSLLNVRASNDTRMGNALNQAFVELKHNGRDGYRKMIVLISDGNPTDDAYAKFNSENIKKNNITICGILIRADNNNSKTMEELSSDFCYVEASYENLIIELQKLDICM